MNDEILRQLYEGELYPCDQIKVSLKEHRERTRSYEQMALRFKEQLTEDQQRQFDELQDLRVLIESEYDIANFIKGFRLGMQITLAGLEIPHTKPNK